MKSSRNKEEHKKLIFATLLSVAKILYISTLKPVPDSQSYIFRYDLTNHKIPLKVLSLKNDDILFLFTPLWKNKGELT